MGIITEVNAVENFGQIQRMEKAEAVEKKLYNLIGEEVDEAFDRNVQAQLMNPEMIARMGDKLNIVYTPLHGSGNLPVRRNLAKAGFKNVFIVKEQELPDSSFSTVDYPNPEDTKVFTLARKLAAEVNADVLIGTDPDCDRMGAMVKDSEGNFRTDVVLSDRDTHVPFSDKLRFVFLQLPCFKKEESEFENDFERWIYVLKNMETLQRLPFKARKSVFEKLEQIVDIASLSKEERMKYDESIKVYRDQLATLDFAKQKGRAEERLDIAKKMKASSVPVETISLCTGLSLDEIAGL